MKLKNIDQINFELWLKSVDYLVNLEGEDSLVFDDWREMCLEEKKQLFLEGCEPRNVIIYLDNKVYIVNDN